MEEPNNLTDLLRQNKQTYIIDLLGFALLFEDSPYKEALLPHPEGIYLTGDIEPKLFASEKYFTPQGLESNKPFKSFKEILDSNDAILSQSGRVLIPRSPASYKKKYFSYEPSNPTTAVQLIHCLVSDFLSSTCRHNKVSASRYHSSAYSYILPSHHKLLENGSMESLIEKLFDELTLFIGNDIWHIYFTQLRKTTLIIEKTVDFRIYEYYRLKFEEAHEE